MCIDGKTKALAKRLKGDILSKIDNVDLAKEMIAENIKVANSQVARMAELYYEHAGQFRIERQLAQVWTHRLTKLSALRGAIVSVLQEYVDEQDQRELASLELEISKVLA